MQHIKSNTYFIAEDVNQATRLVDSLKQHNLSEQHMGVIGNRDTLATAELPEPDLTETSEVVPSALRGASIGGAGGLLTGIAASAFPPAGLALGASAVAAMTAGGAALGTWTATMIGVSENSPLVEKFTEEIDNNKVVVLADIETDRESVMYQVADNNALGNSQYGTI